MTDTEKILSQLPDALLGWYAENKRELPWRQDKEPYHIWLSEIMLQQTRVEAVKGYYRRFLQTLPTIACLAEADDGALHKLWEGLGYYSRVRNLKKAAQVVMDRHGGVFPREFSQVLALPGIGPYTAGAICSIAFDQKTPAVDGNVLRLYARLTGNETPVDNPAFQKQVRQQLEAVYPAQAGEFTQALMELGATLCGPNRKPDCALCPCREFCLGHQQGNAEQLPVRTPKKERRREEMTVFILRCGEHFALCRRPSEGLLADLWQFPNLPGHLDAAAAIAAVEGMGAKVSQIIAQVERKHIFTHITWEMRGIYMEVQTMPPAFSWYTPAQIRRSVALPTAFRQFWKEIDHV